jgi:hypothetical protein
VPPNVRVIYILPIDADPWSEAKLHATQVLEDIQKFFRDEMERCGYGLKSFEIATNGNSLVFHQIVSGLKKIDFETKYWNNCKNAAQDHSLRDTPNIARVTLYFYEAYAIIDGRVTHAGARGWARGKGGEAFLSSLHLKMAKREWIGNDDGYEGKVFDWISPEPMKSSTLSWNGRGRSLGDVSGSGFGTVAHELGHCFGLNDDKVDRKNRQGSLMGNGFRGMRGYFRPDLTDDFCVLREKDAAILNTSDFFAVWKLGPKSNARRC